MTKLKWAGVAVGALVGIWATGAVISGANWAWRYWTAPIKGAVDAEQQLESAPSRIQKYNYFHDLCASIKEKEAQIDNQLVALESATSDDERSRIRQNLAAIRSQRMGDIAQYNADAHKDYTRARFHDSDLPYTLTEERYDGDNRTQCYVK